MSTSCLNTGLSDVSLTPEDDPKILECCISSENLTQFDFGEFPHHPREIITPTVLNDPTCRNLVDFNHVSMEARKLPTSTYPLTRKFSIRNRCAETPS
jgi:hypothetical protein